MGSGRFLKNTLQFIKKRKMEIVFSYIYNRPSQTLLPFVAEAFITLVNFCSTAMFLDYPYQPNEFAINSTSLFCKGKPLNSHLE